MRIFTILVLALLGSFVFSQEADRSKPNNMHKKFEEQNEFRLVINQALTVSQQQEVISILTPILGEPMQTSPSVYWTSTKMSGEYYIVKIINNAIFVRGKDKSAGKNLKATLEEVEAALLPFITTSS